MTDKIADGDPVGESHAAVVADLRDVAQHLDKLADLRELNDGYDHGWADAHRAMADVLRARAELRDRYPMGPSRLGVPGKAVHHINGRTWENVPENLAVVELAEHAAATKATPTAGGPVVPNAPDGH